MTGGIAAFVAARLDEDEQRALQALEDMGNRESGAYGLGGRQWAAPVRAGWKSLGYDPPRVLREVEARRKRLALLLQATQEMSALIADDDADPLDRALAIGRVQGARESVMLDTAAWSDHPGYDPTWAPPP
jgi:hypothetical protein